MLSGHVPMSAAGALRTATGEARASIDARKLRGYALRMDLAPDLIVLPGRDPATADEMATLLRLAGLARK